MIFNMRKFFALFGASAFFLRVPAAWSCAVCFGSAPSSLQRGFFWGIFLLLALPPFLFSILAFLVLKALRKKASAHV